MELQTVQSGTTINSDSMVKTIEAVGTSSTKIIEGRQTTERYVSGCVVTGEVKSPPMDPGDTTDEIECENLTITSSAGNKEYSIRGYKLRVPVAGTYNIGIKWEHYGASYYQTTMILKAGGETIYTGTYTGNGTETESVTINLGKFDKIELWGQFYYGGSSGTIMKLTATLTVQQL